MITTVFVVIVKDRGFVNRTSTRCCMFAYCFFSTLLATTPVLTPRSLMAEFHFVSCGRLCIRIR